ncbi:MAG: SH3 domain-containing protein, partial [Clostridia bacterium]|nr:SH3 domain-containing protein [Clostridia bacterium]
NDAVQEAEWIAEKLQSYGCQMELPVFLDMEDSSMRSLSKSALTGIARAYCDEMLAQNYLPGIYVNKSWAVSEVDLTAVEDCAIWIAQYNTSCTYTGHYDMWQYTDKGSVSGINGDVDLNHCYVDYKSYIFSNGLNGFDNSGAQTPENEYPCDETYVVTNQNGAQTFSSASSSSAVTGAVPYDHQIYVYETDGTFGKIIYGAEESYISLADAVPLKLTYTLGESLGTYRVTASALNIRSGPSTSYTSLGTLPEGTEVEIIGLSGSWCRFKYNGADAYLSSNYLEYISKTVLDSNKGTGENTVITSAAGETFNIPACPYARQNCTFEGWSLTKDGGAVYSENETLTAEKSVRVLYAVWKEETHETQQTGETYLVSVSSTLNVRTGPGTEYDKIGSITNNTQVYVYETSGSWGKIIYNGEDAWISLSYALPLRESIVFEEGCGYYQVTATSLNVRSGAGANYASLGYLSNGDIVKTTKRNGVWAQIDFNGAAGWASTAYMKKLCVVQYDSNKGTGSNMITAAEAGAQITLSENLFTRDDHAFEGWSLTPDGSADYPDGGSFTVNDDVILYAVWKSDKICVYSAAGSDTVVNENNSTVSGIPQGLSESELLNGYICADADVSLTLSTSKPGTGSVITALRADGKSKDYIVVVCGDIDGDGLSDGRDAVLAQAYLNNYLTFMDMPAGSVWAIDTDKDLQISESDVLYMIQSGACLG